MRKLIESQDAAIRPDAPLILIENAKGGDT
jgi:hypothetical protein